MTTIKELLDQARGGDAKAAVRIAETLRMQNCFTYDEVAKFVEERRGITAQDWEALLLEGETDR